MNIRDLHIGDTVTTSGDTVTTPVGCVEEGEELTVVDINRETNAAQDPERDRSAVQSYSRSHIPQDTDGL